MITYSKIQKSQLEGALRLDAEYYQPEYLDLSKKLKFQNSESLSELAFITDGIHASIDYDADSNIRCFSAQAPKDNYFENVDQFISEKQHNVNKRTALKEGDILLSSVGTIGNAAVIDQTMLPANADRHVAIIRLHNNKIISPYFLSTFLNSKYGRFQSVRESTGNVQLNLFIDKIKTFIIPRPKIMQMQKVDKLAVDAFQEREQSEDLYSQAENMLLEELGLKNFESENELWNVVNFSEVKNTNRVDAEYFQPKYQKILSLIRANGGIALGELATIKKGIEPGSEAYQEEGKLFIRVSSISKDGITDKDQKYLKDELYDELKKDYEPKVGEILLTKDASPGIAYAVKEPIEGIIASGVLRAKLKEDIEPEYLALVINSLVGQLQVERDAGGSIIAHWKPDQVKELQVPILPKPTQQKIADLVRQSHEAREKAKQLLEEAKQKVEELIEKKSVN